ncbi:SPFH domain-containing protein, partial [Marinimicrobium sp. UBA4509]
SRHTLPKEDRQGALWREIKTPQAHEDVTDYLVTQDENLIDLQFALHYRIENPAQMTLQVQDLPTLITRTTEAALWKETAGHLFFELLSHGQHDFAQRVASEAQRQLRALGIGIQVVDAQVLVAQPPAVAVRAYRDLLNAEQEKRQYQTRAEAQQIHDRLMAQAERTQQKARVSAEANERILQAEGDVERFLSLAEVYRENSSAVGFEQQLQHTTDTLRGRRLWLTDPALDTDDIRLWGPQSLLGTDDRK